MNKNNKRGETVYFSYRQWRNRIYQGFRHSFWGYTGVHCQGSITGYFVANLDLRQKCSRREKSISANIKIAKRILTTPHFSSQYHLVFPFCRDEEYPGAVLLEPYSASPLIDPVSLNQHDPEEESFSGLREGIVFFSPRSIALKVGGFMTFNAQETHASAFCPELLFRQTWQ